MQVNREWISISDMMAGLMMVFLFIAILYMNEIKIVITGYENVKQQLNHALNDEFKDDLGKWNAEILPDNTVRFKSPEILFDSDSHVIKFKFKDILDDFFPRYLDILTHETYENEINEVRVEGHTSSKWDGAGRWKEPYLNNMELSQDRAKNVLVYTYKITKSMNKKKWVEGVFRANGMSSSKLIKTNGVENPTLSRRVEFRVLTKAEEKIYELIEKLKFH